MSDRNPGYEPKPRPGEFPAHQAEEENRNGSGMFSLERFKREWLSLLALFFAIGSTAYLFPKLPKYVPGPFESAAAPAAYNSREWSAFFPPGLILVLCIVFLSQRNIDSTTERITSFWRARPSIRGSVLFLLWWIQFVTLNGAAGHSLPIPPVPATLSVFLCLGALNYFNLRR